MPFKSKAQRRKFAQLLVAGKISAQTFEEWNRETGARDSRSECAVRPKEGRQEARRKKNSEAEVMRPAL
jgi:hypothetical protein